MLDIIKEQGIVAVLRADSHEQAREYMNACVKGGIKALELTYSIPNVNELIEEYKDNKDMIIGVGSVLNGKMAKDSILAGAKYVVSPGYNEEINDVCHEMGVTYFPGCMTVTEIMPTGGVNIDNIEEWFKMGVSCVGVGGALFKGSLEDIENLAKEFVNKIEKIRS